MSGVLWEVWARDEETVPRCLGHGRWHNCGLHALWRHILTATVDPETGAATARRFAYVAGFAGLFAVEHSWTHLEGARRAQRWADDALIAAIVDMQLRQAGCSTRDGIEYGDRTIADQVFALAEAVDSAAALVAALPGLQLERRLCQRRRPMGPERLVDRLAGADDAFGWAISLAARLPQHARLVTGPAAEGGPDVGSLWWEHGDDGGWVIVGPLDRPPLCWHHSAEVGGKELFVVARPQRQLWADGDRLDPGVLESLGVTS